VETKQGNLRRTIKMDGQPLTPQQVSAEDARIQHFLSILERDKTNEETTTRLRSEQHFVGMLPERRFISKCRQRWGPDQN